MEPDRTFTTFAGPRRVAHGELAEALRDTKAFADAHPDAELVMFEDETGRVVDFDLRGTVEDVLARELPPPEPTGRGRPRLGVTSREVSLLPRHWAWLEQQPSGASAALRRLVEEARRHEPGHQRARRVREAASRVLTALAGDRPGYEEAARALFAKDTARFASFAAAWPEDVREHLVGLAEEAERLERGGEAS